MRVSRSFGSRGSNFVDGNRTEQMIADELAGGVGPVPNTQMADFLAMLEKLGLLVRKGH